MYRNPQLARLEQDFGICLPHVFDFSDSPTARAAMDAAIPNGALVTAASSGVPAYLATIFDPTPINIALAPLQGTKILGAEEKRGDWTKFVLEFMLMEMTGYVTSYGDYARGGISNGSFQYIPRQSYHYQTNIKYGEREADMFALTGQNLRALKTRSAMNTLNRTQNYTYLFGVAGLTNYGTTNDPRLPAALTPATKAQGGTTWAKGTPNEIFADIQTLVSTLITQTQGLINMNSPMRLVVPPGVVNTLANSNSFGVTVKSLITQSYPNITIVEVPEYATQSGNLAQLWAADIDGQRTGFTAFTEKLRAHQMVPDQSGTAWNQKWSQGTWGAIIEQPLACAQMLGV